MVVILLAKLLGRRRTLCANYVLADTQLQMDQPDLFTANQVIHLRPLAGADVVDRLRAANGFVARHYPNSETRTATVYDLLPALSSSESTVVSRK